MRRALVARSVRRRLSEGANPLDQQFAAALQRDNGRLLASDGLVQFVQELILVGDTNLQVFKSVLRHLKFLPGLDGKARCYRKHAAWRRTVYIFRRSRHPLLPYVFD